MVRSPTCLPAPASRNRWLAFRSALVRSAARPRAGSPRSAPPAPEAVHGDNPVVSARCGTAAVDEQTFGEEDGIANDEVPCGVDGELLARTSWRKNDAPSGGCHLGECARWAAMSGAVDCADAETVGRARLELANTCGRRAALVGDLPLRRRRRVAVRDAECDGVKRVHEATLDDIPVQYIHRPRDMSVTGPQQTSRGNHDLARRGATPQKCFAAPPALGAHTRTTALGSTRATQGAAGGAGAVQTSKAGDSRECDRGETSRSVNL